MAERFSHPARPNRPSSSLSQRLREAAERSQPAEWQQRSQWDGKVGEIVTGPVEKVEDGGDYDHLLRRFGHDPEKVEIVGPVTGWYKEQKTLDENGEPKILASYLIKVQAKETILDLPALYASARTKKIKPKKSTATNRTTVVALADAQIGKVAARGGTPELVERLFEKRALLAEELKRRKPEQTVLAEVGDLFENFESGGNPMFTNDLSLIQQMDVGATEITEFLKVMLPHGHVDVVAVPSNHTAWRNGKQALGHPGDDLGLGVHRNVERVAEAAGWDVSWTFPGYFDEHTILDVRGTVLGVVHGNQYAPGKAIQWWAGQQHGGQPMGAADILLAGHYHHLIVMPSGRNPYTGKSKWFLQCPTLDNGSDWYRHRAGDDSDPGLLIFDITDDGFDLQSLTVL